MSRPPEGNAGGGTPARGSAVVPASRQIEIASPTSAPASLQLPSYGGNGPARPRPTGNEDELTPALILRMLRRRWLVAAPIFALVTVAGAFQYKRQQPVYEAAATIRVDKKSEVVPGLTPGAQGAMVPQANLGTEMQVIQSRAMARDVVARTGYMVRLQDTQYGALRIADSVSVSLAALPGSYELLPLSPERLVLRAPSGFADSAQVGEWLEVSGLRLMPSAAVFQETAPVLLVVQEEPAAVERLRGAIAVSMPARDAQVLRISARDPDPLVAARVANAVAEGYTVSQTSRRQAGGRTTVEFIRSQLDTLERQLAEAETKLRDWRSAQKVVVPGAEADGAVALRSEYEKRVVEGKLELENIESLLGDKVPPGEPSRSEVVRRGFRTVLSAPVMRSNSGGGILSTLIELESRRADLRLRRTDADPDLQVLNRTIADYERQGQLFVGSYIKALRNEIDGAEKALTNVGTRLARVPGQELELTTLQRNTEVLAALQSTLRTRLKEAEITNASTEANSELLDQALPPTKPVSPVLLNFAGITLALGAVLAMAGAVVRDRMDRTIHSREELERATGAPVLAVVPSFEPKGLLGGAGKEARALRDRKARQGKESTATDITAPGVAAHGAAVPARNLARVLPVSAPRHVASEAYRMLRTNLRFAPADHPRHVVVVTSATPGDGKSTTALNYAATIAVQRKRVLLIDGDMRRGTQHHNLGVARNPGLSAVLTGELAVEKAVRAVQLTDGVTLDLLASGDAPPNPAELLGGGTLAGVVAWARAHYDAVVIDTPPVNLFADGLLLATAGDAVLLVGRANKSAREEVAMAAQQVQAVRVPLCGVVLNDYDVRRDSRYGNSYYQYDRSYYKYYAAYADA